ncbi:hypothetical protein A4H97_27850 [Niastella yeongjuensis]|uniref:DUF4407 domain-containing protein n=1 Tax=Niastella yeongjuensis TaxID=354355 RepID=A0A1V9EUK8_9BACT|nr:DUF4407 domain-containing protein [Niastella yeongjuensis]OQP49712.1 hypothetical protein A4H97_27850 [Niastella yeongjuensis]SEP40950.1 protein of unknown function [Niastella yeongjuensis]
MADNQQAPDNGLYTYDSFTGRGPGKKADTNFLWWCSGAHQELLKQFPSEHSKYWGLGGVILATFVLAALSSGYAIYSVFGNWMWTICFAIIWGLIIFNFDRFLVATMRKYGVSRRKQMAMALPRMALAILIGFTIARPLELKIFEKEINTKVIENTHKKIQLNDSLLQAENTALMQNTEAERNRLFERKKAIEDDLSRLQQSYVQEADGTAGSGMRGVEKIAKLKRDAYNSSVLQSAPELLSLTNSIHVQDSILANAKNNMEAKRAKYELSALENVGFLERNKALTDLSAEEDSVYWTSFLLSLLIILIEVGPIISKLIMPVGPYDIALAKEELTSMAASENDMRANKEMFIDKKNNLYKAQKEFSEQLVEKMTTLQQKHIDQELDKWERGEWNPRDHRASMDEVMRKIKERYQFNGEDLL